MYGAFRLNIKGAYANNCPSAETLRNLFKWGLMNFKDVFNSFPPKAGLFP